MSRGGGWSNNLTITLEQVEEGAGGTIEGEQEPGAKGLFCGK